MSSLCFNKRIIIVVGLVASHLAFAFRPGSTLRGRSLAATGNELYFDASRVVPGVQSDEYRV